MQRGLASVSVSEVAEAAGVTKPTIYYHFGDKEGLYAATLCDVIQEVGGYVRQVTESALTIRQKVDSLVFGYFLHADSTMEPVLHDTQKLLGQERASLVWNCYEQNLVAPIRAMMEEGMRADELRPNDPDMLVRALLALLDSFTAPEGHSSRTCQQHRKMADAVVSLFLDGVTSREVLSS